MRDLLLKLFGTTDGVEITLFSIWHILYIVLIVGLTIGAAYLLKNKTQETKEKVLKIIAYSAIALYIADFFIQPLSRDSFDMDVDKLPFHICTLTACFIPFAQFNKKFDKIKDVISCFAIVAPLMYITYPGSALGGVSFYSYKVVQTFIFHGLVFAWGVLSLTTGFSRLEFKKIWKELIGLVIIALWAAFGNAAYSHEGHHFDWFFITGSTFPFVPTWLMPFAVITAVFGMCAIIFSIDLLVKKQLAKKSAVKEN